MVINFNIEEVKKDRITVSESSISIDGSTESSYNFAWTGIGTVEFGRAFPTISGAPELWDSTSTMSGSIQRLDIGRTIKRYCNR